MAHRRSFGFAASGAVLALLMMISTVGAAAAASVRIGETSGRYHFSPTTAYINVGGKVTWTNGSDAPHTVTSDSGTELASATLGAGKTFSHTFAATGSFAYHCTIHTYMVGNVVVLAAGVTAPSTDAAVIDPPTTPDRTVGLPVVLVLVGVGGVALAGRRFRRAA